MAKLYGNIASSALMTFDKSFARANGQPLDSSEVYYSLAAAKEYAAGAGAYIGQKIVVIENDIVTHYSVEDAAGTLKELGAKPISDNKSIEVNGNTISIYDFGKAFYKYVAETETEEAHYEKVEVSDSNPWKAGLEPKVVTEEGKLVIGWFEPNPTTVEGVKDQVTAVQGTVNDLDEIINKEGGLVDQVENLQEEIGHAATETGDAATGLYAELENKADKDSVYTKEEADGLFGDKANVADVYTKEETKSEIGKAVSAADHLKRKIVASTAAIYAYIEENEDAE
jgi:hypothetical protein